MEDKDYKMLMERAIEDIEYICEEARDHETSWPMFKALIKEAMKKNQMFFDIAKKI